MSKNEVSIAIPARWVVTFGVVGTALGVGAAFIIGPIVNWLLGLLGDAPGPLRLAAALPMQWAVPVLAIVGLCVGVWMGREWQKENGTVVISAEGVTTQRDGASFHVARDRIAGVFIDGAELVLVDQSTNELLRTTIEQMLVTRLQAAFQSFDYPWEGTANPNEQQFMTWVDGKSSLDTRANGLLRDRQRALTDERYGAADDARDELRNLGITVRDRNHGQEVRVVPPG